MALITNTGSSPQHMSLHTKRSSACRVPRRSARLSAQHIPLRGALPRGSHHRGSQRIAPPCIAADRTTVTRQRMEPPDLSVCHGSTLGRAPALGSARCGLRRSPVRGAVRSSKPANRRLRVSKRERARACVRLPH